MRSRSHQTQTLAQHRKSPPDNPSRKTVPRSLAASGNEVEQGLLFLAINASLVRQFEFIQQSWLNNPKFNGLYDERDPLSSAIAGGDAMMTMQAKPVRERLDGLPRFVTVRGAHTFSCLRFGR